MSQPQYEEWAEQYREGLAHRVRQSNTTLDLVDILEAFNAPMYLTEWEQKKLLAHLLRHVVDQQVRINGLEVQIKGLTFRLQQFDYLP